MEIPENKNSDYLWWILSALTGALIWSLPAMMHEGGIHGGFGLLVAVVLSFSGGIAFGYFEPLRYWRWAAGSTFLLPVVEITSMIWNSGTVIGSSWLLYSMTLLFIKLPVYVLQGVPVLIGASLGAAIQHSDRPDFTIKISKVRRIWLLFALAGLLCCLPYFSVAYLHEVNTRAVLIKLAIILGFFASACIGFIFPRHAARSAFAVGTGFVALVVLRILVDTMADATSHNLFPFEILIAIFLSYPFTFIGAYTGSYLRMGKSRVLKTGLLVVFATGAMALLTGPFLMKLGRETVISQKSNELLFKVRHTNMGTPVRGNNLWLQFEANRFKIEDKNEWDNNQVVFVSFDKDSLGFARISDVTRNEPVTGKFWVKTRALRNMEDPGYVRINYPFSNFLLDKKNIKEAERAFQGIMKDSLSLITLKVFLKENKFLVGDLCVDGLKFEEIVKNPEKILR